MPSGLARMANKDHRFVEIMPGDTIIMSSSPIPGNEGLVNRVVDNLFKLGANVLYNRVANVHVRGHAAQEELKLIFSLVKPRYFIPVHGEYRHMTLHAKLAQDMGIPTDRIFVLEKGQIVESGRHEDLLDLKGLYYAMWRQQIGERETEEALPIPHRTSV